MILKFSKEFVRQNPQMYEVVASRLWEEFVYYMVDRKYRTVVNLRGWLEDQVENATPELYALADKIQSSESYDKQVYYTLLYIKEHFTYITDDKLWKMPEKWETAHEAVLNMRGDCETGALLMYVTNRLKGVPANRMWIMAGDVNGGGHAWLAYRPEEYPLNWVFLDWCYWFNSTPISYRTKFYVHEQKIVEYTEQGFPTASNYYTIWFAFNENKAMCKIKTI